MQRHEQRRGCPQIMILRRLLKATDCKEAFQIFRKAEFAWKHHRIQGGVIVLEKVLFPLIF